MKATRWQDRFWAKVDKAGPIPTWNPSLGPCWLWTGYLSRQGYGTYAASDAAGRGGPTHRIAYRLEVGPIPDGFHIDHLCRNRACCRPSHLEPVTPKENSRRSPLILRSHCSKGHEFVEGSYYDYSRGRVCKVCQRERVAKRTRELELSTARFDCEFCGKNLNKTGKSKHIKSQHPEHYKPRQPGLGITPERKKRRNATQRERRRRDAEERGGWL